MNIQFSSSSNSKKTHGVVEGDFEDMMKKRKDMLPEIEQTIQKTLKDYNGQNICIVIQHEDENGMPDHSQMILAGVSRLETQVAMARSLDRASDEVIKMLMDTANGDVNAMLSIASALAKMVSSKKEEK